MGQKVTAHPSPLTFPSAITYQTIVAGWLDAADRRLMGNSTDDDEPQGAVFAAPSTQHADKIIRKIDQRDFALWTESGTAVGTILDLLT